MTTMTDAALAEFKMPDVGEGLTEAEILKWYVQPGDAVTDGQVVCEVETAKAAVELPIPFNGVVRELRFPEGTTVDVGQVIIAVDVAGGSGSTAAAPAAGSGAGAHGARARAASRRGGSRCWWGTGFPRRRRSAAPARATWWRSPWRSRRPRPTRARAGQAPAKGNGRPLAKPPVRKLAKDLGVDLASLTPSGPDGIITREDVHAAVAPAPEPVVTQVQVLAQPQEPVVAAPAVVQDGVRETRIPVKGVRKATAAAMVGSAFTAPHVTEFVTVDVTRTMKLVEELKADKEMQGLRVNPLLLIAKALLVAIKRNPEISASWDEAAQEIVRKHYVNLGIAAATPRGLIVPNIKDAHAKTLPELATALGELVVHGPRGQDVAGAPCRAAR